MRADIRTPSSNSRHYDLSNNAPNYSLRSENSNSSLLDQHMTPQQHQHQYQHQASSDGNARQPRRDCNSSIPQRRIGSRRHRSHSHSSERSRTPNYLPSRSLCTALLSARCRALVFLLFFLLSRSPKATRKERTEITHRGRAEGSSTGVRAQGLFHVACDCKTESGPLSTLMLVLYCSSLVHRFQLRRRGILE